MAARDPVPASPTSRVLLAFSWCWPIETEAKWVCRLNPSPKGLEQAVCNVTTRSGRLT
jgi:hypothetical protein